LIREININMTPEEIYNRQVWTVLQTIKEDSFTPDENGVFFYDTTRTVTVAGENSPTQERKIAIINNIARDEKAVEIVDFMAPDWKTTRNGFYLKIIEPQFSRVYVKYQKACDITSYLNDYQERMFKGDNLPEFSQVEHVERKILSNSKSVSEYAVEELYKDEVQLVGKLLGICSERTKSVVLKYPAELSKNDPDKAGFNNLATLQTLCTQYSVFKSFSEPLPKRVSHGDKIEAQIDFSKLKSYAEILHDKVESWKGNVFGIEEQKRRILDKLQGRFKKNPQEQYEYSEWLLGSYTPLSEDYPLGHSIAMPDSNRTDIRYQFMRAMRELEKDGHFEIVNVEINFDAKAEPKDASSNDHRWSLGTRNLQFNPAKHCRVTLQPKNSSSMIENHPEISWNGLFLNTDTGWGKYNNKRHRFRTSLPPYKVLKKLLEAKGEPVTYDQFFEVVDIALKNNLKYGKTFICQKIRDIRKQFKINRKINPHEDIFFDTGNGFQLKHYT